MPYKLTKKSSGPTAGRFGFFKIAKKAATSVWKTGGMLPERVSGWQELATSGEKRNFAFNQFFYIQV